MASDRCALIASDVYTRTKESYHLVFTPSGCRYLSGYAHERSEFELHYNILPFKANRIEAVTRPVLAGRQDVTTVGPMPPLT